MGRKLQQIEDSADKRVMLSIVAIGSDAARLREMQHAVLHTDKALLARGYELYPVARELIRTLNAHTPDVVLLDLEERERALQTASLIRAEYPKLPIIGVTANVSEKLDFTTGIAHTLSYPFDPYQMMEAVHIALDVTNGKSLENLTVFLPSKAGSGCSTVVLNTASAMANALGQNVLLMEADLRSGALSIALNHEIDGSMQHILANSQELDIFQWQRCLTKLHGVNFLFSDRNVPKRLPGWEDYYAIVQFIAARYDRIIVDLPELVNPGTAELVRRAKNVFVVCTQEILSLKLAELRCQELAFWGVQADKIQILINRWQNQEMSREDVRRLLNCPVMAVFPNDYHGVRQALLQGTAVAPTSKVGASFVQFARLMVNLPESGAATVRRPFASLLRSFAKS